MEKSALKRRIDEKVEEIISMSGMEGIGEKLDELLSLKGQYDVEPSIYDIPSSSIIRRHDFGHGEFIVTRKFIIYRLRGGMSVLVSPRMACVYGYLKTMLSLKDREGGMTDEEKDAYDALFTGITTIFNLPLFATVDDEFMVDIVRYAIKREKGLFEKISNNLMAVDEGKESEKANTEELWKESMKEFGDEGE